MRRCASRKKSAESITSAARLNASLCSRIAPRTERSASRLCGSVRSATAASAGMDEGKRTFFLLAFDFFRLSLGHHFDLDGRGHVALQADRDGELAEPLDR